MSARSMLQNDQSWLLHLVVEKPRKHIYKGQTVTGCLLYDPVTLKSERNMCPELIEEIGARFSESRSDVDLIQIPLITNKSLTEVLRQLRRDYCAQDRFTGIAVGLFETPAPYAEQLIRAVKQNPFIYFTKNSAAL